jgi:hypothetical protein
MIAMEEVAVLIKDSGKIKENHQEENVGGSAAERGKDDKMQKAAPSS